MRNRWSRVALVTVAVVALAGCDLLGSRASRSPVPSPTPEEAYLLSGIRPDASIDCVPVRSALPAGAVGAVECSPNEGAVDRFRVTLFTFPDDLLALYFAEMTAHGVALNSGGCVNGNGEQAYVNGPQDASVRSRNGCFIADVANFRAVAPGEQVYIAVIGKSKDVSAELDAYAWKGNEDVPGAPTLWRAP